MRDIEPSRGTERLKPQSRWRRGCEIQSRVRSTTSGGEQPAEAGSVSLRSRPSSGELGESFGVGPNRALSAKSWLQPVEEIVKASNHERGRRAVLTISRWNIGAEQEANRSADVWRLRP